MGGAWRTMGRAAIIRGSWVLLALSLCACSETVAVLTLQLKLPFGYDKGFKCAQDPRWSRTISLRASCDEGRTQSSFELQKGARLTLLNVPLGDCTVEVETTNAHGRTVLTGEADVTIVEGQDQTIEITLLPAPCMEPNCDSDRDGLYITDEKGLKTNPRAQDTDGDGLFDGVEVAYCCSDPLKKNQPGDCSLRIQHLAPELGVVGALVKVSATDALKSPMVHLGGVPMASPLTDATDVHGHVGKGAVLGDVVLTSGGVKSEPYELMFATLERELASLVQLQVKAGTGSGLMHEVVDAAHLGKLLLMLGKATASWSSKNPMLLIVDRAKDLHYRYTIPVAGSPVALATSAARLVVLQHDAQGQGLLVVLELDTTGKLKVAKSIPLKVKFPVDVALDPRGDAVVLFSGHLALVPLAPGPGGAAVTYRLIPAPASKVVASKVAPACTGLTLYTPPGGGTDWVAFAACNMPSVLCPSNKNCPPRATLVRVSPLTKCLADTSDIMANCWRHFQSGGVALGAPEVSPQTRTVYVLTSKGIFGASLINGGLNTTKMLAPKVLLGWPDKATVTRLMAADSAGQLYVVPSLQNRARLLRADPENKDTTRRKGRPFVVGGTGEEGLILALHPDGSVLDVVQRGYDGSQGLTSICVKRCAGCICSD